MTLAELIDEVRRRADMEHTQFVKDDELTSLINLSYGELYDLLVSRFEDYYSSQVTVSVTSGNTFPMPADLYKIRGLDFSIATNDWLTVRKFNFAERNVRSRVTNRLIYGIRRLTYRLMGDTFYIQPEDQATGTYRLWYIPRFERLVNPTDIMGDVLDFEEYVIVDAAIRCLVKEESDPSALMAIKAELKNRIINMANNRDAEGPERVADVSLQSNFLEGIFPRA